jgi:hypothetical protein
LKANKEKEKKKLRRQCQANKKIKDFVEKGISNVNELSMHT